MMSWRRRLRTSCVPKEVHERIKTARKDAILIGKRLNDARADYEVRYAKREELSLR